MSEWKPGDVVVLHIDDDCYVGRDEIVRLMEELIRWWPSRPSLEVGISGGTAHLRFIARAFHDAQFGRLVVIDPADREAARRLLETYGQQFTDWTPELDSNVTRLQAALREFAAPTPPKPDEPMGLGAVVEEDDGTKWVRTEDDSQPWVAHLGGGHGNVVWLDWADVAVVRVLSHGVTDEAGGAS